MLHEKPISSFPIPVLQDLKLLQVDPEEPNMRIVGSYAYRGPLYPSDIDLFEPIEGTSKEKTLQIFTHGIQKVVHGLVHRKGHYFLELKAGVDPRYNLNLGEIKGESYFMNPTLPSEIERLFQEGLLSQKETTEIIENMNIFNYEHIRQIIRKHYILRWNATEISRGYKNLPKQSDKVYLEQAIDTPNSVINMELIAIIKGQIYDESNFFVLTYVDKGKHLAINAPQQSIDDFNTFFRQVLKKDMYRFMSPIEYNPFKSLKRMLTYSYFTHNLELFKTISKITDSVLGQIYQTKGQLGVIVRLLETGKPIPIRIIKNQLDMLKFRLGNFTFIDSGLLDLLNQKINGLYHSAFDPEGTIKVIKTIQDLLSHYLNHEVVILMKKNSLWSLPI